MARNQKRRQPHKRNPELCRICGQVVFRIERDHPFRRVNDPDFTIPVCVPCHIKVTSWDNILDRHIDSSAHVATPFLYILHRIQLIFSMRRIDSVTFDLRHLENSIIGSIQYPSYAPARYPRKRRMQLADDDKLVLLADISAWAKRASELTLERLRDNEALQFRPDFDLLVSVVEDMANDPRRFYELLSAYLSSPNGQSTAERANALMSSIQLDAPLSRTYNLWRELASDISQLSEAVAK